MSLEERMRAEVQAGGWEDVGRIWRRSRRVGGAWPGCQRSGFRLAEEKPKGRKKGRRGAVPVALFYTRRDFKWFIIQA